MSFLRSRFAQAVLVLVLAFAILRFGIRPAAPWSVLTLYMAIVLLAVLVYVSSNSDSWRDFMRPIRSTLVAPDKRLTRLVLLIAVPLLFGYYAYTQAAAKTQAPPELRAVHPAPPGSIQFRGKEIRNCMYCHGDNLDGRGHFAYGFNPPPANFQDPGTIAMLQEAFLFWRISKGGPGLPKESTPWNSVMPAWEDRLSEEQIWQVIMYLYDATGQQPRRWETAH